MKCTTPPAPCIVYGDGGSEVPCSQIAGCTFGSDCEAEFGATAWAVIGFQDLAQGTDFFVAVQAAKECGHHAPVLLVIHLTQPRIKQTQLKRMFLNNIDLQ